MSEKKTTLVKLCAINVLVFFGLFIVFSLILRSAFFIGDHVLSHDVAKNDVQGSYTKNTIRATYPNYQHLSYEKALNIFVEYGAPEIRYMPYVAWRRQSFSGESVNISGSFGTRHSVNHSEMNSVWFLGGSTMWGTGATDEDTIPSFYARLSGEAVWNLGETGYNTFQELNQLLILLAKGYDPDSVVFYDGVNEGMNCTTPLHEVPTHSKRERYSKYIERYPMIRKELRRMKADRSVHLDVRILEILKSFSYKMWSLFVSPYRWLVDDSTDTKRQTRNYANDKSYLFYAQRADPKGCVDHGHARRAAEITVRTWQMAYDVLGRKGIPVLFVLQPTTHMGPEEINIEYIINVKKKAIAERVTSYRNQYNAIREVWHETCKPRGNCDRFLDLSRLFNQSVEPIYIDDVHLSPNGNRAVANGIYEKMGRMQ